MGKDRWVAVKEFGRKLKKWFLAEIAYSRIEDYPAHTMPNPRETLARTLTQQPVDRPFDPLDAVRTVRTLSLVRGTGNNYTPPDRPEPPTPFPSGGSAA